MPIIIIIAANLNAVQRTRIEDFRDKRKFPRPSKYKKKKKKKKFPPCIDCIISKMRREGRSLKKRNSKGKKNS